MESILRSFSYLVVLFFFALQLSACKVTQKLVNKPSGLASGSQSPENAGGLPTQLTVLSHQSGDLVASEFQTLSGQCVVGLGPVVITGDFKQSPVFANCSSGEFSETIELENFNANNDIRVVQQDDADRRLVDLSLGLFARLPFCGDGVVNQSFEVCDGTPNCDDKCQEPGSDTSGLVLARVVIDQLNNRGNGNMSPDVSLGSATHSIPESTWFPICEGGTPLLDGDTNTFSSGAGVLVSREAGRTKIMLKTSLSASDLEHVEGHIEYFQATLIGLDLGVGSEGLENDSTTVDDLTFTKDEVTIDGDRVSEFFLTETVADDSYFPRWVSDECP